MCAYEALSGDLAEATPGDGQARGHAVSRPRAASEEEEGASAASGQTGLSPAWRHWPAEANGGSASGSRASGRGQRGACPSAKFRLRFGSTVRSLQGTAEAPSLNHSSTLLSRRCLTFWSTSSSPADALRVAVPGWWARALGPGHLLSRPQPASAHSLPLCQESVCKQPRKRQGLCLLKRARYSPVEMRLGDPGSVPAERSPLGTLPPR